jgi:acetamidase/formamidase
MCFVHSGNAVIQQTALGPAAATAFSGLAAGAGEWGVGAAVGGMDVAGSGAPDVVAGPAGARVLDGYGQVLHTRWNRDLPPAAVVRPGEVIQLLCRDALDIGEAACTLTPQASMTVDLGRVHPLTGPVEVAGAEPGDILEVEVLDVAPLGPDLMENAKNAVRDMIDWLVVDQQLSLHEAYALCRVAGDLKISETVDLPNWVVSMTLPRGIFT